MKILRQILKYIWYAVAVFGIVVVALQVVARVVALHRTEALFSGPIANTTFLEIMPGPSLNLPRHAFNTLVRIDDKKQIRDLLLTFQLTPSVILLLGGECACGGDYIFRFHDTSERTIEISLHGGSILRCPELWKGDAKIGASFDLGCWMTEQGVFEQIKKLRNESSTQPNGP